MKKAIFALIGMIAMLLAGCAGSSSELDKAADNGEETNTEAVFDENSFDIQAKDIQYNKEENSLSLSFETTLPDDTQLNMLVNLWQPDDWEEYALFTPYSSRISQRDLPVTVKDGLITYTIDNSQFGGLLVPNSLVSIRFFIPVSEESNNMIYTEFPSIDDFKSNYPDLLVIEDEAGYSYEICTDFIESEIANAYTPEEIYAYFEKETIPYKELEKNSSKYEGTPVSFKGKILQIQTEEIEDPEDIMLSNFSVIRLALDGDADEVVFVTVLDSNGMEGIVSDDTITVYGKLTGSETYESVAGYQITIPSMDAVLYEKE